MSTKPHNHLMIQIVTPQGDVTKFPGGSPLERDLIEAIAEQVTAALTAHLLRAGDATALAVPITIDAMSFWRLRSAKTLKAAIQVAVADFLRTSLRNAVTAATAPVIAEGVRQAIYDLKSDSRFVWSRDK